MRAYGRIWAVLLVGSLRAAEVAPERIELPEIACSAPDGAPFDFPKIGHERHAVIVVESAGCSGTLLAGQEVVGKVRDGDAGRRFDFAEALRGARTPVLRFRPAEAGYGEVRMRLEIVPRIFIYGLRAAGGVVTFTARNTLENTADLVFRVEAGGASGEQAGNIGPNSERDYRFELGELRRGERVRVVMDKAEDALEGAYRFVDFTTVTAAGRPAARER